MFNIKIWHTLLTISMFVMEKTMIWELQIFLFNSYYKTIIKQKLINQLLNYIQLQI